MHMAACEVATGADWRLHTLLKVMRFFTTPELVQLYKAHNLAFVECITPGLDHAAPSVLNLIDKGQRRFLRELELTEVEALELYRFAPLPSRRDMAVLGALHKITFGFAPPQLAALFPVLGSVSEPLLASHVRG